jgi:Fe-S cluster assembly ATP-binding protein
MSLIVKDLQVRIEAENLSVIKGLSLEISPGTVHALMGRNGSGKSSFAYTVMGHPRYSVAAGSMHFDGHDLLALSPDKRAKLGIFLAFQHPIELPGVTVFNFLRESYQAAHANQISVADFKALLFAAMDQLSLDQSFAYRSLNDGFSGGEKKRLEMLQLMILKPKLAILDEIDSGLDVSALKMVIHALNQIKAENPSMSFLIITHYQKVLDFIVPDFVHIMANGIIEQTGDALLSLQIELKGYERNAQL